MRVPASLTKAVALRQMIAQCWLHIGTEKTGSTSIQTFLAQNRMALLARGWLYSTAAGERNHYRLVAYALDDERYDTARRLLGHEESVALDDFRHRLLEGLRAETAATAATALVLSNELLATRLRRPAEIARLKGLCDDLAQTTKVVVYIRNQTDFLASRHTNVIWEGGTSEFSFAARTAIADYALLLDRWAGVFGKDNLVVRRYVTAEFPDGDVIADFARVVGLDTTGLPLPPRANPSLDARSLVFLRGLNRRLSHRMALRIQPLRGAIVRVLQRRRGGRKFAVSPTLAAAIDRAYRESNDQVSAAYFGSRFRPLFPPAVLVLPEDERPVESVSALAILGLAASLFTGLVRDGVIWATRRLLRRAGNRGFR